MAHTGTEAASETTKQIVTLATGMIALSVTFAEKFKVGDGAITVPWQLPVSWLAFGATVFLGVWTLMAITGVVNTATLAGGTADANSVSIRFPAILMVLSFVIGIFFAIAAGYAKFYSC
ncbi:hypothetical protein [Sneathiella sp.]|uniref:hypothetical protein n=1 Tax=Sneathiella sp. TaxID=1964365 RepID=UPI003566AB5A